jgi:hypothetical protein
MESLQEHEEHKVIKEILDGEKVGNHWLNILQINKRHIQTEFTLTYVTVIIGVVNSSFVYVNSIAAITYTHSVANWVTSTVHTHSLHQGSMIIEYRINGSSILVLNYSVRTLFY